MAGAKARLQPLLKRCFMGLTAQKEVFLKTKELNIDLGTARKNSVETSCLSGLENNIKLKDEN